MFVSIDQLGPKEGILSIAQQFSENQMDPFKLFPDFCLVQWYKKKNGQIVFFTGKIAFFLKNLCFQQPLRSLKNALISSRVNVGKTCWPL